MRFIKAHTNGNDFVIIDGDASIVSDSQKKLFADRKFGIGCDQIIFVKLEESRCVVDFFNQDGSHADMCGNGSCAVVLYVKEKYDLENIDLEVSGRMYQTTISGDEATILFPMPKRNGDIIDTGNKHLVLKMADISRVEEIAKANQDCNLHFVDRLSDNEIRVKTFERGVGWTLACGSGAIAVGFHSEIAGKIKIIHDGGESMVEVKNDHIYLTTKPKLVFSGEFYV